MFQIKFDIIFHRQQIVEISQLVLLVCSFNLNRMNIFFDFLEIRVER